MNYSVFQYLEKKSIGTLCCTAVKRSSCCYVHFILAALLLLSTCCYAENKNDIKNDIENYRWQMQRLQRGILDQQEKTEETVKSERNLLQELEDIDTRLKKQQKKVEDLDVKIQLQQMLINIKQDEITSLQSDREKVLAHLRKRSGAYYKMGKIGFLNVTFSSQSLPELLRFHDAFQTLISYDKDVIIHYRTKIQELQRARDAQKLELELLQQFIATTQAEKEKTDQIRTEKTQLLTHIRTQRHLHEQAAKEMEAASEDLSKTLISLKTQKQNQERTFDRLKGRLRVPVKGRVITFFNQEKMNKLGVRRKSTGIAISATDGSKVQAVAEGAVIFSGYLRGYGNTVIIHHGYQYYSVTSRLEKTFPNQGDEIKAGTNIGQVSDTSTLIDDGLYFEIRHGKDSLDPLEWLDTSKLQLTGPSPVTETEIFLPVPSTPEFIQ